MACTTEERSQILSAGMPQRTYSSPTGQGLSRRFLVQIRTAPFNQLQGETNLKDLLDSHKRDILVSLNCHALATIQSFDPTNQTVSATMNYKRTTIERNPETGIYSQVLVDYPVLYDCPVIVLTGGNASLTMPIAQGDTCLILFNDRDIDNWFESGQIGPLASARLHSFSDGIALIGLRSSNNPMGDYDPNRAVLQYGTTRIGVGSSKVIISNQTRNLNTLLQNLITQVKNLAAATAAMTVTCTSAGSPSSAPLNAAAISAISSQLTTVATQIGELLE